MRKAIHLGLIGTLAYAGLAGVSGTAMAEESRWSIPRYAGVYLVDATLETINGFECEVLVQFGFLDDCNGQILMTLHADGTLEANDQNDYAEGFDGAALGTWQRPRFRSTNVSTKSLALLYTPEGEPDGYRIRQLNVEFDAARQSFVGQFNAVSFGADQDPLDPAAIPIGTVTGSVSARRFD